MASLAGKLSLAVVVAGVLGGGLWLATRLAAEDAPAAPATTAPELVTKENAVLPAREEPALPQHVEPERPPATKPAPAAPPAPVAAAPAAPSPGAIWDDLYRVLDATVRGELSGEDALRIADELVALIAQSGPPELNPAGRIATWTLLDDRAQGKVQLVHRREPKATQAEFLLTASLVTRPGAYTGYVEDAAATAHVELDLGMTAGDVPGILKLSWQVDIKPGAALMHATPVGQALPMGGVLTVEPERATWSAVVAQHEKGADGRESITHREQEARVVQGSLDDPRVAAIGKRLVPLRTLR